MKCPQCDFNRSTATKSERWLHECKHGYCHTHDITLNVFTAKNELVETVQLKNTDLCDQLCRLLQTKIHLKDQCDYKYLPSYSPGWWSFILRIGNFHDNCFRRLHGVGDSVEDVFDAYKQGAVVNTILWVESTDNGTYHPMISMVEVKMEWLRK